MRLTLVPSHFLNWIKLLRWNKPSGRLILLIPAGWALWLTPNSPPDISLVLLIFIGGILVSGAGCIANDIWDSNFDKYIERTKNRPLAKGEITKKSALFLLVIFLILSLLIAASLPIQGRNLSIYLAILALPPILLYPSTKRWLAYPQAVLAFCWGFAVLIPWAASEGSLLGGFPLIGCWIATFLWTFGFDTVYAMSDRDDDEKLNLKSSALSLGENVIKTVSLSYALACTVLGVSALTAGVRLIFLPFWLITTIGMQSETWKLKKNKKQVSIYGKHFFNQVLLGSLLLLGLILGRSN